MRRIEQGLVLVGETIEEVIFLDPSTGEERWSADGDFGGAYGDDVIIRDEGDALVDANDGQEILSVDGSLVGCAPGVLLRSEDDELMRIDDRSGEDLWDREVDRERGLGCDGGTLALTDGEEITTVRLFDGEEQATGDTDADPSSLLADSGVLVVVDLEEVIGYRASADAVEEAWTADVPDGAFGTPLGNGDVLFVSVAAAEVLSLSDGESRGDARFRDTSLTRVTTESLLAMNEDGVEAYHLDDLEPRWEVDLDDAFDLTIGGDRLFVLVDDELVAYG